ncbi:MAG: fibronectin type III domain-containing protein [Blautia sp.]|uniref:fibronectin type III domain-containing protein n=1 Tax=Blautia sp. TaxID=1955243 RepID=UPI0039957CFA
MQKVGRRIIVFFMAVLAMLAVTFESEVPVSAAASVKNISVKANIQASSTNALRISWNRSSMANGYVIYRRESLKKPFKRLKVVNKNAASYLDRNLTSSKPYQYAVRAYRKEGKKNVYSKYVPALGATRPQQTTVKAKAVSSSRVDVSWNKNLRSSGYCIYRRATGEKWVLVADLASRNSSYSDQKVKADTKYVYAVRPYKKAGNVKYMASFKQSSLIHTPENVSGSTYPVFNQTQKDVMKKILYAVETGGQVYGRQDYKDFTEAYTNSGAEHSITIGAGQWYATEAQRLLKLIHTKYPATWKKYDPKNYVWNDVVNKNWSTYKLSENSGRAKIIVKLIGSPDGIKCQDQLMYEQIDEIQKEIRKLGITEPKAVGMFINIRHQGGYGAVTRVLNKTKRLGSVTLDNIYKALQTDTGNQVGAYKSRQKCVYTWLKTYMK